MQKNTLSLKSLDLGRFIIIGVMSLSLISCSSVQKNTSAVDQKNESSSEPKGSVAFMDDGDTEVREIDEISQLPKTNRDFNGNTADLEQIPVEINSMVVKWIDYFQGRGRGHMEKYLSRSARYLPIMKKILKDRGLPEDLVYVALIESGFSSSALSHAGAVGYWQFMRGTGRDYGLKINTMIDERRDPIFATLAAADYFSGLYNLFGSWYLAIASYNAGENKIKRLIMTHHTRDFWQLIERGRMPVETMNYVPKFIAASMIGKNPSKYGFHSIDYMSQLAFDEVKVNSAISLRRVAEQLNVSYSEIKALNPSFKTDYALAARGSEFYLRVPVGRAEDANRVIASAKVKDSRALLAAGRSVDGPTYMRYKIRRGDSLTEIANRFNVSIAQLAKANKLSPRANLMTGQNLLVPQTNASNSVKYELKKIKSRQVASQKSKEVSKLHVVRRGDTLAGIARKYKVPMREIAGVNNLRTRSRLLVGDRIQIPH